MAGFDDALSSFLSTCKNYYKSFRDWAERKKYRLGKNYRVYKSYVKENLGSYGKFYGKYFLFEYLPYVAAYGLMINFPAFVLLDAALTVGTVVSWGVVSYLVVYDVQPLVKELLAEIG